MSLEGYLLLFCHTLGELLILILITEVRYQFSERAIMLPALFFKRGLIGQVMCLDSPLIKALFLLLRS